MEAYFGQASGFLNFLNATELSVSFDGQKSAEVTPRNYSLTYTATLEASVYPVKFTQLFMVLAATLEEEQTTVENIYDPMVVFTFPNTTDEARIRHRDFPQEFNLTAVHETHDWLLSSNLPFDLHRKEILATTLIWPVPIVRSVN